MRLAGTALEKLAIALASVALSVGLIAILSGFFANRDQAGVSAGTVALGQVYPDLGHAHLRPGELRPAYDSEPPTSGAHIPEPVEHDASALSDDQLLQALEQGNVVFAYGSSQPPAGLEAAAGQAAEAFSPGLAAAGQAAILMRRPGVQGVVALAWTRMLHVARADDPRLVQFAEQWLGRGAAGR